MRRFGGGKVGRSRSFSKKVFSTQYKSSFATPTLGREALCEFGASRLDLQRSEREMSTPTVQGKSYERILANVSRHLVRHNESKVHL